MKRVSRLIMVGFIGALLGLALSTSADARGPSNVKLVEHGWTCVVAGPHDWVHCFRPSTTFEEPAIPVLVFDSSSIAEDGDLLGTEMLIREDVFHGQPCPRDGGEYEEVGGLPYLYYGCHHFARD